MIKIQNVKSKNHLNILIILYFIFFRFLLMDIKFFVLKNNLFSCNSSDHESKYKILSYFYLDIVLTEENNPFDRYPC